MLKNWTIAFPSGVAIGAALLAAPAFATPPQAPIVERTAEDRLTVRWTSADPVDVLVSDRADAVSSSARIVSPADRDGEALVEAAGLSRLYVILRDVKTGESVRVAERLVPLTKGSNFRDVGGYAAAEGKRVSWGRIYRSGASAMLGRDDLDRVSSLGLTQMVDLRSDEERQLAPSKIDGVPYTAVGYSMATLLSRMNTGGAQQSRTALYHGFPTMLAPQMRLIFNALIRGEGPIAYNCSAGQDRTGFATAMILSALGVSREDIYRDYLLSVKYRQPANEMPHIDPVLYPGNAAAEMFAHAQENPAFRTPEPLQEADGTPFLKSAFDEIDTRWGSVEGYLRAELGVGPAEIEQLRRLYTEK